MKVLIILILAFCLVVGVGTLGIALYSNTNPEKVFMGVLGGGLLASVSGGFILVASLLEDVLKKLKKEDS